MLSLKTSSSEIVSSVPAIQKAVAEQALSHLLNHPYFDICQLQSIIEIIPNASRKSKAYDMLHALHCIHYKAMSPEVIKALPDLIREAITPPSQAVATAILDGVDF